MAELLDRLQTEIEKEYDPENADVASCYIVGDSDTLVPTSFEIYNQLFNKTGQVSDTGPVNVSKSVRGSNQNIAELGDATLDYTSMYDYVEPPYDPESLKEFIKFDPVNYRCVKVKVTDAVLREYEISSLVPVYSDSTSQNANVEGAISKEEAMLRERAVKKFIKKCNDVLDFNGILERAAMDYETVGWGAFEVIRGSDMKVKSLAHIPAERVRVQKGWKFFLELRSGLEDQFTYYQPFGQKVISISRSRASGYPEYYDPDLDGELSLSNKDLRWNLFDNETGQPLEGNDLSRAANEVLWIPKHHCATVYYGLPDSIPCLGDILANVNIRQFLIDFFENNTVPRYAIVIEGGDFSDPVKKTIQEYFKTHIKGQSNKIMIIPIKTGAGQVKLRFERLSDEMQEGSFQETRKNNNQQIMTSHGVSPAIIGIAEAASLGSGKGLSQAEIYKDRIVTPMQRLWGGKLSKLFCYGLGIPDVELRFTPLDIRDLTEEAKYLDIFAKLGAVTINEIRKTQKLEPIEGGDRPFIVLPGGIEFVNTLENALSSAQERLMRNGGSNDSSRTNDTTDGATTDGTTGTA